MAEAELPVTAVFVPPAALDEDEAALAVAEPVAELLPDESAPPVVAPVAAIRASRSDWVVQVTLVPALLTRGKAAQLCFR